MKLILPLVLPLVALALLWQLLGGPASLYAGPQRFTGSGTRSTWRRAVSGPPSGTGPSAQTWARCGSAWGS